MIPQIVISKNNQIQVLETTIAIKIDAECNETTPMTSFDRFHEDFENMTEMTSNSDQKDFRNVITC